MFATYVLTSSTSSAEGSNKFASLSFGTTALFTRFASLAAFRIVSLSITSTDTSPLASIVPVKSTGPDLNAVKVFLVVPSITNSPTAGAPAGAGAALGASCTGSSISISVAYFCLKE